MTIASIRMPFLRHGWMALLLLAAGTVPAKTDRIGESLDGTEANGDRYEASLSDDDARMLYRFKPAAASSLKVAAG